MDAWRPVHARYGVDLVLAGRRREDFPAFPPSPACASSVRRPRTICPALYSQALAFVYPSLYEGFGLPVLEAMQCGACVITSTDPAIGEVAGDAGVRLDPRDGRAWTEAMLACAAGGDWLDRAPREFARAGARVFLGADRATDTRSIPRRRVRRFHA